MEILVDKTAIPAPVSGYYGCPYIRKRDGEWWFGLTDIYGPEEVRVGSRFVKAFMEEFGPGSVRQTVKADYFRFQDGD